MSRQPHLAPSPPPPPLRYPAQREGSASPGSWVERKWAPFLEMLQGEPRAQVVRELTLLEHGRQALTDALWARLPAYVQEDNYAASATQLNVQPQSSMLVRITFIFCWVPSGATGTLTLGRLQIPVDQGANQLQGCSILLSGSDPRQLNVSQAGICAVLLTGEQVPEIGTLR